MRKEPKRKSNKEKANMQRIIKITDLRALQNLIKEQKKKQRHFDILICVISCLVMFLVWEYLTYSF